MLPQTHGRDRATRDIGPFDLLTNRRVSRQSSTFLDETFAHLSFRPPLEYRGEGPEGGVTPPPTNLGQLPFSIVDLSPGPTPCYAIAQHSCARHVGNGGKWCKWCRRCRWCRSGAETVRKVHQSWTAPRSALERGQKVQMVQMVQGKIKNLLNGSVPRTLLSSTRMRDPAQSTLEDRTHTDSHSQPTSHIFGPVPQHMKPCS